MTASHQPGSPGVDLDSLDRLHSENLNLLDFDLAMHRCWPAVSRELRTLRARVGELEDRIQQRVLSTDHEKTFSVLTATAEYWNAKATAHHARAESAEARVKELEAQRDNAWDEARALNEKRAELRATIRALESQLATARSKAEQYEQDWYAAKSEFGTAAAKLRGELAAAREENADLKAKLDKATAFRCD